jgi:hypothetical protein
MAVAISLDPAASTAWCWRARACFAMAEDNPFFMAAKKLNRPGSQASR